MNNKMELLLSEGAVDEITQHAQETFPEECCGVILTDGTIDPSPPFEKYPKSVARPRPANLSAHRNHRLCDGL